MLTSSSINMACNTKDMGNMFQSAWDSQGICHAAQRMYCLLGGRDSV
jgi:hypothetical protein